MLQIDRILMKLAINASLESTCKRRSVGAATFLPSGIHLTSVNGCDHKKACAHKGLEGATELPCFGTHAEARLIKKIYPGMRVSTIAVTTFPCKDCSQKIVSAGFKRVLYLEDYGEDLGREILEKAGIEIIKVSKEDLA